jgi:hypothetical protein
MVDADLTQGAEVEADQAGVVAAQRLDPADDAGAAAEGHDRDALRCADLQYPAQRLRVGGHHHPVRSGLQRPVSQPRQVDVAAPGCVAEPILIGAEDVLLADGVDQRLR